MPKERAHLDFGDDMDLSEFQPKRTEPKEKTDQKTIEEIGQSTGFVSREPQKQKKRRRVISPYKDQLNVKCRPEVKDLFQEIGERLVVHDHTTFERAIFALIEKEGYTDLAARYKDIVK
jgi:restriction endonuclease Mrr